MVRLQAEAQIHQFTSDAWFGVYKQLHDWRWSYGNESLGNMTYWYTDAPSGVAAGAECCVIRSDGFWDDVPCLLLYYFVCYDERNTGTSRYIYISTSKTWYEAQSYCRLYHTDLASARDATEQSIINGTIVQHAWFGLFRITWRWLDQTNPTNITWKSGQPDNQLPKEDCGYLSNFQAADAQCSDLKPFFCHRDITGQIQSLRFKVQSDQNMNDPAVKAALLEKILQKLKEHGMEQNVTLKWRERPGGDVFHKIKDDGL
ncbi:macrophage mannose receptor 1-like [Trichomycterus rosablanca]|uniref:macrophage mannose receptor 1-like n=1 Tax=Trichomycterus rosablanca TaxID=2290929 RepID=UPI002F35FDAA